ncbi:DHA2 family efflux MFS transporter permease subunit [Phytohalomonas tamaricis]|uniref:DHA2 family efflux MFS transporter permease subunit n=1 Tax=Phytohalomonas tamaricis TaxID=2081032 RepID=UPI0021D459F8|nr:DHA2 family efflux MFS transporter permease subunit [Phytohalomonas tamaricis]
MSADAPEAMPSWRLRLGFVAAVFGMFMAILDIQIVASSLNEIQAGVAASQDEISWIQTAYLIAEIIMIPLSGVMTRILSTRVAFVISSVGFTLASLGCAMATTINELIVLRAIQGFMGGAMIPITQAVSFTIFPRRKMGAVQAVIGLVATVAPSVGPTLGGYITEYMSWHWLFLVNAVPGVLVSLAVWRLLDIDKADLKVVRTLDIFGLILMALFLGTLEFVLEEGPDDDWFDSRLILSMALISVISAALFFIRMFTARHPIINLRLFAERNFAVGIGLVFVLGIALYGLVYLMPLFFGTVRGFSSLQIGEVMFVTGAAMFLTAPAVGILSDKIDLRLLIGCGVLLTGIGSMMNANLTDQSGFWEFFWPQIVRGVGMIMCLVPSSRVALGMLPREQIGNGSGMFSVMRNLGGAVGLALLDTVRDWREDYHWNQLIPAINEGRETVVTTLTQYQQQYLGAVSDPHAAAIQLIVQRVQLQADVLAYNDIFLWLGLIYFLIFPVVFLLRRS